jgi:hypothetical protein
VDMCDLVNSNFARHGKDCVKALKLKIMKKSAPDRQMLALIAMEMCMKNCGQNFHLMAIAKDVPHEMAKLATAAGVAEEVHDKTLVLIREWAQQIRHPHLQDVYDHVRSKGVRFPPEVLPSDGTANAGSFGSPPRGDGSSLAERAFEASPAVSAAAAQPLYTPRLTTAEIIGANLEKMDPADAAAIRAAVAEAEAEAEAMERAERAGGVVGSPPSSRRGGGVDFGGRVGVLRRDDGMPLNLDPPGSGVNARPVGSPPRGYASLEEESFRGRNPSSPALGVPADDRHAAELLAAQRASAEEAAARAREAEAAASMAATDMSSPEAVAKLKHDLAVASETVASLRAALAAIDVENDPGAAAGGPVAKLAEQCRQMKPRVVALVESATDEGLLMAALALHDELGDVLERQDSIAAAAAAEPEMRAALAASLAEEAARLALEEGKEKPSSAAEALVDLFDAPSSSGGAANGTPSAHAAGATMDASLVDLLSPGGAGGAGGGGSPSAAEKGKAAAVSDPFAGNPFAAPASREGGAEFLHDPFAASGGASGSQQHAHDPFAAAAAASSPGPGPSSNPFAVHDPFAAAAAASPPASTNPFAAPSPGGAGFGAVPATPPGSGSGTRAVSNPLFDARYNQAGAPMVPGSSSRGGASGSQSSPAPVPARQAADPFAALAEAARSPEKNPFATSGK